MVFVNKVKKAFKKAKKMIDENQGLAVDVRNRLNYLKADIEVIKDEIVEFYGNDKLEGVKTINDDYKLDAVFIALGSLDAFSIPKFLCDA